MAIGKYDTAGLRASHSPHPGKLVLNIYHNTRGMRAILPLSLVFIPLPSSFPSLPLSLSVYKGYFPLTKSLTLLLPDRGFQMVASISITTDCWVRVSDSVGLWAQDLAVLTCTPGDLGAAGLGTR